MKDLALPGERGAPGILLDEKGRCKESSAAIAGWDLKSKYKAKGSISVKNGGTSLFGQKEVNGVRRWIPEWTWGQLSGK